MSTLGIVEATIFLLNQFFEVNLEKERIFADVHFTLFFVAIINALMACIIYILAMLVANERWVKMETLDFNHYVAIRRKFDQIESQLKAINERERLFAFGSGSGENANEMAKRTINKKAQKLKSHSSTEENSISDENDKDENTLETVIGKIMKNPSALKFGQYRTLKRVLERKYSNLLVQIKFHDMRVHFIEKHNLPSKFR